MVNISTKKNTYRKASAEGMVKFTQKTFKKIQSLNTKKGSLENIAIVAGIMGAKKTSEIVPLCHNIEIENVEIKIKIIKSSYSIKITSSVSTNSKTGVEMEAISAVSAACLTIYDMCKSLDKKILIKNIRLINKTGGKSDFKI